MKGCSIPTSIDFTKVLPTTIRDHICPAENGTDVEPTSEEAVPSNCISSPSQIATQEFIVLSLFSTPHWVKRLLSNAEILSIMDSPVQVTMAVNEDSYMVGQSDNEEALVSLVTPLKTIQEATRILFGFQIHKEERYVYDSARLGPLIPGLLDVYAEIDQANVEKMMIRRQTLRFGMNKPFMFQMMKSLRIWICGW